MSLLKLSCMAFMVKLLGLVILFVSPMDSMSVVNSVFVTLKAFGVSVFLAKDAW